jgi:phospholipase/carboxylesterase
MSLPHHYIVRQPSVSPAAGEEPNHLLILLHGYGSNEEDLMGLASYLDPRFRIVSIRAPDALDQGGYCWFPLGVGPEGLEIRFEDAEAARDQLSVTVTELQSTFATAGERTILLGFSQGAAMALAVALFKPELVGGVAFLSGRSMEEMIPTEAETLQALQGKQVLMTHGRFDPLIPIGQGREAVELLQPLRLNLMHREYDMGHEINQACLTDVSAWLQGQLDRD